MTEMIDMLAFFGEVTVIAVACLSGPAWYSRQETRRRQGGTDAD